jgi:hypothetical protein
MFFLFPFVAEPAPAPASSRAPQYRLLPLLPEPNSACARTRPESGLASAVSQAGSLAVDLLKRALSSMASSMTALGNRANVLFSQVVAGLAYERMMRETVSLFGMFFPAFAQPKPGFGFPVPWVAPARVPALPASFGLPGFQPPFNPWGALTETLDMWTSLWTTAAPWQRRSPRGTSAPVSATFAFPGFSWTFALA